MRLLKLKDHFITKDKKTRLHNASVPIVGLTGSISTGKSSVAKLFKQDNFCVINADLLIKDIYAASETQEFLKSLNPSFVKKGEVDFSLLREQFFTNEVLKNQIEQFLYQKLPHAFLSQVTESTSVIIYDVPLLFEKKLDNLVDQIIVVHCSLEQQLSRLIKRDRISKDLAQKMIASQINIEKKAKLATHLISNDKDMDFLKLEYQRVRDSLFV